MHGTEIHYHANCCKFLLLNQPFCFLKVCRSDLLDLTLSDSLLSERSLFCNKA